MKAVKSSTSPYDNTERKIIMEMLTERDLRRSIQRRRIEEIRRKSTFNGFILGLCLGVAIVLVTLYLYTSHKTEKPEELNPQVLENEPTGREFAWSSEIPEGISQKLKETAKKEGMYCNVEYLYMGKRISIGYTGGGTTISIRGSIYLENASIYSYSSGNGVVIYGYEGYMFKDGEESLYMQVVASGIEESYLTDNSSKIVDGELLDINSMRIGNTKFPVVTNGEMFEVYVPNELEIYKQYMAGEIELTPKMDLGWHSVQIY